MAVAYRDADEGRLVKALDRAAVPLAELDGDERVDVRLLGPVLPFEGEDDPSVALDLAECAAHPAFTVGVGVDAGAPLAAGAEVETETGAGKILRTPPALHVLRLFPNAEDERGRRIECALDQQFVVGNGARFSSLGHSHLPWSVRRDRRPSC